MISFVKEIEPPNGGAHLPVPGLHYQDSEQAHGRMQKAAIQRSAEGAGQVQRVLGCHLERDMNIVLQHFYFLSYSTVPTSVDASVTFTLYMPFGALPCVTSEQVTPITHPSGE
jgi:hypothetical protein